MMTDKGEEKTDDEDFDPHLHRELDRPTNDIETVLHILKGCFGTGILAMPRAFYYVGIMNGFISTIVIGILCTYGLNILVKAEYEVCKSQKVGVLDYQAAMKYAVQAGPEKMRKFAQVSAYLVDVFLIVMQLGAGCVYIVFVAKNVKRFTDGYVDPNFSVVVWITLLLPAFITIILIPDLKYLAPFSTVGNLLTLSSFSIVCYYMFRNLQPLKKLKIFAFDMNYPLYFGTTLFAIEAIGVVTSAENNMKTPQHFLGWIGVLNISMFIVCSIYAVIGAFGYWRYGSSTADSITLNIPYTEGAAKASIMLYAAAIFFSYSLQCFVANNIMWQNYIIKRFKNSSPGRLLFYEYIFRILSVILTYGVSVGAPFLGLLISFIGCFCETVLGFVFPAVMDICVRWSGHDFGPLNWILYRDSLLMTFGIISCIFGTYTCIQEGIESYQLD